MFVNLGAVEILVSQLDGTAFCFLFLEEKHIINMMFSRFNIHKFNIIAFFFFLKSMPSWYKASNRSTNTVPLTLSQQHHVVF